MNKRKYQRGFTILEMGVSAMLLVALGGGILVLQYVLGQAQGQSFNSFLTVDNSNRVVNMIAREIRTALPSASGAYTLESGDNQEIIFFSDVDFDNVIERVRYYLVDSEIMKETINPSGSPAIYNPADAETKIVAEYVVNEAGPLFFYYNSDWPTDTVNNPLATPVTAADVRLVKIIVRTNSTPENPRNDYESESSASIRMLKNNL